jgi:hypothetical protein
MKRTFLVIALAILVAGCVTASTSTVGTRSLTTTARSSTATPVASVPPSSEASPTPLPPGPDVGAAGLAERDRRLGPDLERALPHGRRRSYVA